MVVKNNMSALSTLNTLNKNQSALKSSLEKVSSGMKINSAQDDASGYAISERMRVMIRSLDQANENTQNGNSLMKVAEGAVSKTVDILDTLKKKAIQAATDTNTDDDRKTIQKEIDQLIDQIDDNALVTYNGKYLLDGSKTQAGEATKTAFTNQLLSKSTSGGTLLTQLKNRNEESLEIASTDKVTASYVMNGKTYSTTYQVSDTSLEDIFYKLNKLDGGSVFGAVNLDKEDTSVKVIGDCTDLTVANEAKLIKAAQGDTSTESAKYRTEARVSAENNGIKADGSGNAANGTYNSLGYASGKLKDAIKDYLNTNTGLTYDLTAGSASTTAIAEGVDSTTTGTQTFSHVTNVTYTKYNADGTTETATLGTIKGTYSAAVAAGATAADPNTVTVATNSQELSNLWLNDDESLNEAIQKIMESIGNLSDALAQGKITPPSGTNPANPLSDMIASIMKSINIEEDSSVGNFTRTALSGIAAGGTSEMQNYSQSYLIASMGGGLIFSGEDIGKDAAEHVVKTANSEVGLTLTAATEGLAGQISGINIVISDANGQSRKTVNEFLDGFKTTIFASNKSEDNSLKIHTGAQAGQSISASIADMRSEALGLKNSDGTKITVSTKDYANAAIAAFDNALQKALDVQTTIGALEARLNYTSDNLTTATENITASESTIRDADLAKEMTEYTKNNVLLQAAQSMLAQANQNSSAVLSLLQ